jgi:hypothetical protein
MTDRKKFNIADIKTEILEADDYQCTYPGCTERAIFLAHGISKSPMYRRIYGNAIIDHPYNMFSVCGNPEHNDYFNINLFQNKIKKLIILIENFSHLNSKEVWEALSDER